MTDYAPIQICAIIMHVFYEISESNIYILGNIHILQRNF